MKLTIWTRTALARARSGGVVNQAEVQEPTKQKGMRITTGILILSELSMSLAAALTFLTAVTVLQPQASAQGITTGSISGAVADTSGAVIPGATITATAKATNVTLKATSGDDGSFSFKDMPIGTYTVIISKSGFAGLTLENIEVASSREQALGIEKLSIGRTEAVVEVSAAENILETSQPQVTTTFDTEQLTNLPTAGGFDELALLIPGVVDTHEDNFSNSN